MFLSDHERAVWFGAKLGILSHSDRNIDINYGEVISWKFGMKLVHVRKSIFLYLLSRLYIYLALWKARNNFIFQLVESTCPKNIINFVHNYFKFDSMDVCNKAFLSASLVPKSLDLISKDNIVLFTDSAYIAKDKKSSCGFVMIKENNPFVGNLLLH